MVNGSLRSSNGRIILFSVSMIILILLPMFFARVFAQARTGFDIVTQAEAVEISYLESGLEKFKVTINKNGGISQITIDQIPYSNVAGIFVWGGFGMQTTVGIGIAEPEIENKNDYVEARFYGKFPNSELYVNTNYTISKTGLILISSVVEARRDEPRVMQTAWVISFPVDLFQKEKALIKFEKSIMEVTLPEVQTSGAFYEGRDLVYWVDFSKPMEGITFINMAPRSNIWYGTTVRDDRQYGSTVYSAFFAHTAYGPGAMLSGDKRISKVALYIHGPGGYSGNKEVIDLVSSLGETRVQCENALAKYKSGSEAWNTASQALESVNSGLEKLVTGSIEEAKADLENAKTMLSSTTETMLPTIILVVIVIVVIIMVFLRRKAKKETKS